MFYLSMHLLNTFLFKSKDLLNLVLIKHLNKNVKIKKKIYIYIKQCPTDHVES